MFIKNIIFTLLSAASILASVTRPDNANNAVKGNTSGLEKREYNDRKCNGCHKGYCWSNCKSWGYLRGWCYGTKSHTFSHEYSKCETDEDCKEDQCYACAGSCTI